MSLGGVPGRAIALFAVFAVTFGTGQFHRVSSSVVTPILQGELALGANTLGLIAAVYFLASAAFQIPLGLLLDRYGPRRVAPVVCSFAVAGTLVYATGESALQLALGRMLIGAGYGGGAVMALVTFARWVPEESFSTFTSWMFAAGSLGGILATGPLALLVEAAGWRPTFLGIAVFALVLVLLLAVVVRDAPPGSAQRFERPQSLHQNLAGLIVVIRHPDMRYLMAMMSVTYGPGMVLVGLWAGPFFADVFGFDAIQRGNLLFAIVLLLPLGLISIGPLDRIFNSRKKVIATCGALLALMFALLALFGHLSPWLAMALMIGAMLSQGYYAMLQTHCRALFPDHLAGRANTVLNLAGVFGVFAMQWLSGLIIDAFPVPGAIASVTAYRLAFAAVAIWVLLGVAFYLRAKDAPPRR